MRKVVEELDGSSVYCFEVQDSLNFLTVCAEVNQIGSLKHFLGKFH